MSKQPFHEWEIRHDLLNKRVIDGFPYWNYMRKDMFMSFNDEYSDVEPVFYRNMKESGKEGLLSKIKRTFKLFLPDNLDKLKESGIMFLCHPRRQNIDGKMVSIYTDFIADHFPDSVTYQRMGLGRYETGSIYSRNIVFGDKICIKSYIYRYVQKLINPGKYRRIRDTVKKEMAEPFRDLSENCGLHPDINDFAERAAILYFLHKFRKPRYRAVLEKIKPRVIAEVVGGSFDSKIFNELAYEMGIETVELQHGTGTITVWYPDNVTMRQFAKWYFTFGDFWTRGMKAPIPEDHVLSMGFPYHDMLMKEYPAEKRERDKNSIIFLSSRKYGEGLSEVAGELKRLCPGLNIIYKLHPREYADYKERYPALKNSGLTVIDNNKASLYGLFSGCSMQVGVESTAIYEGMSFGLSTYIWDIPKAKLMKDITDRGYGKLFKDASALAALIEERSGTGGGYDINDLFKENSLDNMVKGIRKIAGQVSKDNGTEG